MKDRYEFKSRSPYYEKEREGIKNNTARDIDLNEDKFLELIQHMMNGFNDGDIEIKIIRADVLPSISEYFIRDITDISVYNNLMIITWSVKEE